MNVIIDTCSWLKIRYLDQEDLLDLKPILYSCELWMTHELHKELIYHLGDYLNYTMFSIKNVKIDRLKEFTDKSLDDADLSIIKFCRDNPNTIAISDDGLALKILKMFKIKSFQLSEFIFFLVKEDLISKKLAIKSIKSLRNWKNIKEKKKDTLIDDINQF
jgi:hypothetical protein